MKQAYGIIAALSFILFITKFIIHAYLDSKNGYEVKYSPFLAGEYIVPYTKEVELSYRSLKLACNTFLKFAVFTFAAALILLLLMNFG